jgi:hypothetical protein
VTFVSPQEIASEGFGARATVIAGETGKASGLKEGMGRWNVMFAAGLVK